MLQGHTAVLKSLFYIFLNTIPGCFLKDKENAENCKTNDSCQHYKYLGAKTKWNVKPSVVHWVS
jgi:hypothetical protein